MSSEFSTSETELQFFFDNPFLSFAGSDSTLDDILQAISPETLSPANGFRPQHENISLGQANQLQPILTNAASFSPSDGLLPNFASGCDQFLPHSYSGESLSSRFSFSLQRSHSSGCFGEKPRPVMVQSALLDGFPNSPDFQRQGTGCSSPESSLFGGQIRRVFSTGDLQSPVAAADGSLIMDEASFKVARYSPEQRKERILKYRAKRTQRNFNKTIKYACRKTLADSRPRIRGRFARNDETGEIPKAASSTTTDDDDEEFWVGMHENGLGSHGRGRDIHDRLWPSSFPIL